MSMIESGAAIAYVHLHRSPTVPPTELRLRLTDASLQGNPTVLFSLCEPSVNQHKFREKGVRRITGGHLRKRLHKRNVSCSTADMVVGLDLTVGALTATVVQPPHVYGYLLRGPAGTADINHWHFSRRDTVTDTRP